MFSWKNSSTTTALLGVIALLLLILVIQNVSRPKHPASPPPMASAMNPHGSMPPQGMAGGSEGADMGPGEMVFAAMICPDTPGMRLVDSGCAGAEADKRRELVRESVAKNLRIGQIFDAVVAAFGEQSLTQEALNILRQRGSAKSQK